MMKRSRNGTKLFTPDAFFFLPELHANHRRVPLQTTRGHQLPAEAVCHSLPEGNALFGMTFQWADLTATRLPTRTVLCMTDFVLT